MTEMNTMESTLHVIDRVENIIYSEITHFSGTKLDSN